MRGAGATLLRIALGAAFLMQAYLALFVTTPRGLARYLESFGWPAPALVAAAVIVVHGAGGGMLVLGVWPRLAAAANAAVLALAMLAGYLRTGTVPRASLLDAVAGRPAPAGYEYLAVLVAATLAVAAAGGAGSSGGGGSRRAK